MLLPTDGDHVAGAESSAWGADGWCLVPGYAGERLAAWAVSATGALARRRSLLRARSWAASA